MGRGVGGLRRATNIMPSASTIINSAATCELGSTELAFGFADER